jgi:hypothetical protein
VIDKLFKLSIALAVLTCVAGIAAAAITGSDKAFEAAPVISFIRGFAVWLTESAKESNQETADPKPFTVVASDALQRTKDNLGDTLNKIPAGQSDPRLSVCLPGSVEPTAKEVSAKVAIAYKTFRPNPNSLIDVQAALGQPACVWQRNGVTTNRYLVEGFRLIDAKQKGDAPQVTLTFTNF